jgi:phosphoserine phosphatase
VTALHVFDMDGTLLRETTANLQISRRLDRLAPMQDLEDRFAAGELDEPGIAGELSRLWHDLDQDLVDSVAAGAPWIGGLDEVLADITARGEASMLITMSPEFFARHLYSRGVDVVRGATYPPFPLGAPVDPAGLLTPADKVHLAEAERARRGLAARDCVAYGDSTSDEPLFAHLANSVAVNAAPRIEAAARVSYRGEDLREAYAHGRALLAAR